MYKRQEDGVVNSISDARKAVRYRYKNGADLIKITATGGVMSMAKNGQNPQFTEEVMRAIVNTAKIMGCMLRHMLTVMKVCIEQ